MCGRLNVIDAPIVAFLAKFLGEVPFVESRGNVAPTEPENSFSTDGVIRLRTHG